MAKALIEQRRVLALDAEARDRVLIALDGLTIAPELFAMESSVYLGLRSIYWNLVHGQERRPAARSRAADVVDGDAA